MDVSNNDHEITNTTIEFDSTSPKKSDIENQNSASGTKTIPQIIEEMERNKDSVPKNKSKGGICECCLYTWLITFIASLILGLCAATICYYVFGIKFLIKSYDTSIDCKSVIGDYVIASLVISFVCSGGQSKSNKGKSNNDNYTKTIVNIFFMIIWLVMGVYGKIKTSEENCEEIRETKLWEFAHIMSIIYLCLAGFSFLLAFVFTPCIISGMCKNN